MSVSAIPSLNHGHVDLPEVDSYHIYIAGHLYGAATTSTPYPAVGAVANRPMMASAAFILALGDTFQRFDPETDQLYQRLFKPMPPILNAVGGHDIFTSSQPMAYFDAYGPTYYQFQLGPVAYIILDPATQHGQLSPDQLAFFRTALDSAHQRSDITTIIIATHQLMWATSEPRYSIVKRHMNNRQNYDKGTYFSDVIMPLLTTIKKPIYWLSGDIGIASKTALFYDEYPGLAVRFVATGLADEAYDAMIRLDVIANGQVVLTPVSLTGQKLGALSDYNIAYWEQLHDEPNHMGVIAMSVAKVRRILSHRRVQFGMVLGVVLMSGLWGVYWVGRRVLG